VISVALKTHLEIRLVICMYKTSLLHRPDDYIGFTPSCHPHILQQNCAHGWMWHMSAGVSRILLKNEPAGTVGTLPNIQVEVSTLQTLLKLHNCKSKPRILVQQEQIVAWNTFYAFIPWCVLLLSWLLRFWRKSIHHMVMCYWICAIIQRWLQ